VEQAGTIVIVEVKNFWFTISGHILNTAWQMSKVMLNKMD